MSPRNRSIFGIGGLNRSTSGGTAGGARRRRDRTGRRPSRPAAFAPESLESRIALAVDAFAQQPFTATLVDPLIGTAPRGTIPGWAVVIADSSDDLYLQQVATVPQSLLYADNGGFVGGGSVGGVNALQNIYVTNGERRTDLGVSQDNGPVYAFNLDDRREVTTRYIVEQDGVNIVDGVLEYTQADGVRTRWTFNGGPDGQTPQLLTGPGVGATPAGVYIVPTAISFREPSAVNGQSHLELTWRTAPVGAVPPDAPFLSPFSSNPVISRISYTYFDETTFDGNQPAIPKTEYNILPSTRALRVSNVLQPTTFTLPQATGAGSLGVIPGTLSGTMYFSGGAYPFRIDAFNGNRLVFSGGQTTAAVVLGDEYLLQTGGLKPKVAYGAFDADSGVISLYFASPEVGLNNTFVEQDPGYVSLDVSYGVYAQGQESRSVTVFAGQDITRQFDVDLLVPGSTINIDSPIVIDPSLAGGDISLRATNINLAAKVSSNDRLDIGPSVASRAPTIRTGLASSEIFAGEVVNVFSPSGLEGVGYDPDRPPTVTIVGPNGEVNAVLGTVTVDRNPASPTFGQVTAITVQNPGSGYDNVAPFTSAFPTITIAPPPAGVGAATATAVAVLDAQGSVTGVTITSGGAGYAASAANPVATIFRPQAEATAIVDAAGRLAGFTVTHRGVGYTSRPAVTVAAPVAVASAEIGAVTLTGDGVTGIAVAAAGYGYQAPPRVWIQPPPRDSGGTQAVAEAILDSEGRVIGIDVTDSGSGYLVAPEVRIMAPIPVAQAETVRFDASVAANVFDIRIGEELGTDIERGGLLISPSGSLAGKFAAAASADSVFVQAEQADVVVEGTVWAKTQSFLFQSRASAINLAPFAFTTTSPTSGADSGLLRGNTVAITLANDTPTPAAGGAAFNEINLATAIDSLRVRAATGAGVTRSDPFPYDLKVREQDSIAIEAVAASSLPIDLYATTDMTFTAALATAGDVLLGAGSKFTVSAPVSTTVGQISVTGSEVAVQNSLRVTAAADDPTRDDIVLTATGGGMTLGGAVAAVNNVSLVQRNGSTPAGISGAARVRGKRLAIDADGNVGNQALQPVNPQFYLQTAVDTLTARVGGSMSIDEMTDLELDSVRAGGLVSVRARGVDPGAGGSVAALRGSLVDVTRIDVNAPNGSIDITNNAPSTIIVGNADALRLGRAVSMQAAGNVQIRSAGGASRGDLFVLDAPIAGDGGRAVRGLVTTLPASTYAAGSPGVVASTLTASANGPLALAGLTNLRVGDRLLVSRSGAANAAANGVYAITSLGSGTRRWVLTRTGDSDTAAELPSNTFVRVTDGTAAGKVFQLTYAATTAVPFTRADITVTETPVVTNIGSDDSRDNATFVVSTAAGTNGAAGSLGKMLRLRQVNDTSSSPLNPAQVMDFTFSSQVLTPIRLTEQLPAVTKSFAIDGNLAYDPPGSPAVSRPRITVDGSTITSTRVGNAVTASTVVNGFEFLGAGAGSASIANMTVSGFTKGAAVQVTDAASVLVNGLTLGTTERGVRVTNAYGVRVSGGSAGTTVSGNTITASTRAGVRVEGTAQGTMLIGNTIGTGDRDNNVGVEVDTSGPGRNLIGAMPVAPTAALAPVTATRVSATSFTLPASYRTTAANLFVGLGVRAAGITAAAGLPAATIADVATNATTGVTTVTISGGTVTASGQVNFGNFVSTTANTATLVLPAAVSADQVYLGQLVTGGASSGIPSGARVRSVSVSPSGIVTITLSLPLTATGVTAIGFGAPVRNVVQNNLTGILLANGMTTVTNTTVSNNTFDGIRITAGTHIIGGTTTRSAASNVIVGNGGFGIVAETSGARSAAETIANRQTIRGNYLGVTPTDTSTGRRNGKGNIGLRHGLPAVEVVYAGLGNRYEPNASTLIDAEGNQHSGTPTGGSGSGGTGTTGRRGVPPLPPRRR
jgi:hypothetical protein